MACLLVKIFLKLAIKLGFSAIHLSDLCNVQKSAKSRSDQKVILVISTTNGPNITNQKELSTSINLQVHFIAME